MPESVESPRPPRVHVTLPGGRQVPARLLRWRQGDTGAWWAEVTLPVPAAAVDRVDGEDYTLVEREPAAPPEPRYVLQPLPPGPDGARLVLHLEGCFAVGQTKFRQPLAVPDSQQAASMLRFANTEACTICEPAP